MDIKLSMLFLLIGSIIGLSHLSSEKLASFMREFGRRPAPPPWRRGGVKLKRSAVTSAKEFGA